jgi:hypothetical protein
MGSKLTFYISTGNIFYLLWMLDYPNGMQLFREFQNYGCPIDLDFNIIIIEIKGKHF